MNEFMFGITYDKPAFKTAARWDEICREEGGYGYTEVNREEGFTPGVNHGKYQGWFVGPNRGNPFDKDLAEKVLTRIGKEV